MRHVGDHYLPSTLPRRLQNALIRVPDKLLENLVELEGDKLKMLPT